ncbi:META domain-containing protein [Spirosoma sp. HMF4905]|uniref:META domain-containing protein n=1 Tax=Spirosoma arboris TaxID=2682092 RepID=A0A7K1SCY1_9BACT|nr:META domain-containing protein [Spirosoma arboris]MVM31655.1 META domain-containing protein [Spirosoma arboris]
MRILLFGFLLLVVACRRPSTQFAAMMTPVNQPVDYSRNLKAGDELIAMGNDPGWSLTLNPSKGFLKFNARNGDSVTIAAPERQTDSEGVLRYNAVADSTQSGRINILFRPDSCVDKLSGQRFDYRVEVDYRGKNYVGCGVSLRELALLQDIWVLASFQGNPVPAGSSRNEVPRLEISLTEGRVTGTTGCNRLSGTIKADTHKILFGPLVTTKMACMGEAGQFESKFLHELVEPLDYQVSEGKLTLRRAGKVIMVFKKVD